MRPTLLLLILLVVIPSCQSSASGDPTAADLHTVLRLTPDPAGGDLKSEGEVTLLVEVENRGASIPAGTPSSGPTAGVYSGRLILETATQFRREGQVYTMDIGLSYNAYLNGTLRRSRQTVSCPEQGARITVEETRRLIPQTELGVRPDENLILYIRINVSLEILNPDGEPSGKGVDVTTITRNVPLFDEAKVNYLKEALKDEEERLRLLEPLEGSVNAEAERKTLNNLKIAADQERYSTITREIHPLKTSLDRLLLTLPKLAAEGRRKAAEYNNLAESYDRLREANESLTLENEQITALTRDAISLLEQARVEYQGLRERFYTLLPVAVATALLIGLIVGFTEGQRRRHTL